MFSFEAIKSVIIFYRNNGTLIRFPYWFCKPKPCIQVLFALPHQIPPDSIKNTQNQTHHPVPHMALYQLVLIVHLISIEWEVKHSSGCVCEDVSREK